MIQVLHESNVADNVYGFARQLKDIQQTIETFQTLPADVNDQIEMQNIRIKNAINKINELLQHL